MADIRAITISVGYAPQLGITLRRNRRHFGGDCLVVTSLDDDATIEVCRMTDGVQVFRTDAFTRHPPSRFNKGLAMEEGLSHMGRHGQILIWDADILLPDELPLPPLDPEILYGIKRRELSNPASWRPGLDFRTLPIMTDGGPVGFFQLFHASASCLRSRGTWYDPTFPHAGGGDAYFMELFHPSKRKVLPISALHLGQRDTNWFGVDPESRAIMDAYCVKHKFRRGRGINPSILDRVGEVPERVEIPGYPTDFEMKHVIRERNRLAQEAAAEAKARGASG